MTCDEFKAARKALSQTQEAWGLSLGITRRQVRRIETGEHGVTRTLALLIDAIRKGYKPD